ncbi:alpha-glucosidase C-terminal domain-containing protein, partial [Saccharothrix lopnurensis]
NIWLGDRDAVRTPMQWTPDRNAGFSSADPGRLYLPTIADAVYGYQGVNVEAQVDNQSSLLNWTRRMLRVRALNPVFALGTFRELGASNPSVLTYVRGLTGEDGHETTVVLCVNNLSRFAQPVELDLCAYRGRTPVEMTGGARFPRIGDQPYSLTLAGYGFYWLELEPEFEPGSEEEGR